ncbi:MAG: T9SS type A sorting domain-containing protein, partial [Bacteroidetes bacterium]|nr:T9SS type A sorting domain-containing protein [Bacteroidota bacterium]
TYKWYQNGNLLPGTGNTRKATTGGTYIVETNTGCPGYDSVVLTFIPTYHPTITMQGADHTVSVGQLNIEGVTVTGGSPGDTISWYKNRVMDTTQHSTTFSYFKTPGTDTIIAVIHKASNPCYHNDTSGVRYVWTTTGVNDLKNHQSMMVYPNPFTDAFTVYGTTSGDRLILYDMTGKMLQVFTASGQTTGLATEGLQSGCYLLRITDEAGRAKGNIPVMKR